MTHIRCNIFFLFLFVVLAAIQISEAVDFTVTNKAANTPGGIRFESEIGDDYCTQSMESDTEFIWDTFQQTDPADRKDIHGVILFVEDKDVNGDVAYTQKNEIHIRAGYIEGYSGDIKTEIAGVLLHEMTHVWQNLPTEAPRGLIEGIADYMRLQGGYAPSDWVEPGQGDRWDQGYDVTARFLDYYNSLHDGFVAELNRKMKDDYSSDYFVDILGKSVDQLWTDYKATYNSE